MKKKLTAILLLGMILGLVACGRTKDDEESGKTASVEAAPMETASTETAPIETESIKKSSGTGKSLQSGREEKEEESEESFYILSPLFFLGERDDNKGNFRGDGFYVEYYYDADTDKITRVGRFEKTEEERKALETVAEQMGIAAEDIRYENTTCCGYPALLLEYTGGEEEGSTDCYDVLVFGEDALYWTDISSDTGWIADSLFRGEFPDMLYLQEVTKEMLLAKSAGDFEEVMCSVRYGGDDILFMQELTVEDLMESQSGEEAGEYSEYPLYEKGDFSLLDYNFYDNRIIGRKSVSVQEFMDELKTIEEAFGGGLLCNVTFVGGVPVAINQISPD